MADEKIRIHFICEAMSDDSPSHAYVEELARVLVHPALPAEAGGSVELGNFGGGSGELDHYTIDMMAEVDLVIADLTDLSQTAYFILGARAHRGLPIVYLCDEAALIPYDLNSQRLVRYTIENPTASIGDLAKEIERALIDADHGYRTPQVQLPPLPPRQRRLELASRIEATAEAIRGLRINSVSGGVEELIAIAEELKNQPDENNPSRLQEAADRSLRVIFALLDELSSQPGARLTITGAVSLIVGGAGFSGASAFGAGLAFWYGKDAFTKFIDVWGKRGAGKKET
jgi:hypothetical protein